MSVDRTTRGNMWKPIQSITKTRPNGEAKPFSPRRIALSRGVFAHNYMHNSVKCNDFNNPMKHSQTDNITLKSYVDLADAYASIVCITPRPNIHRIIITNKFVHN